MPRMTRLADCNPHWVQYQGRGEDAPDAVYFECPEGHDDCKHVIPFTPAMDGTPRSRPDGNRAIWHRTGDTFENLTLAPSIRRIQRYPDRAAALAAGCLPDYITETLFCSLHVVITDGTIHFCGDSK